MQKDLLNREKESQIRINDLNKKISSMNELEKALANQVITSNVPDNVKSIIDECMKKNMDEISEEKINELSKEINELNAEIDKIVY